MPQAEDWQHSLSSMPYPNLPVGFPQRISPNMIAISESTPGPLGRQHGDLRRLSDLGIAGGMLGNAGLLPHRRSSLLQRFQKRLDKFKNALLVEKIFYGLRPCSIALITAAGLGVAKISLLNIKMIPRHQISYPSLTGNAFFLLSLCGMRFGGLKSILLFTLPFLPPSASSLNCNLNSSIPPGQILHKKTRSHVGYRAFFILIFRQ